MKIALIGYGKMGRMIEQIALQRGHEIVCRIDADNQEEFDSPAFVSADVAIEFTTPTAAYGNFLRAFAHHVKVVSGSTGWMRDHREDVERMVREEGQTLFWASNFSVGVAIFSAIHKRLAEIMDGFTQYEPHMTETHHIHKLDAPSGTAITLAEELVAATQRVKGWQRGKVMWDDGHTEKAEAEQPDYLTIDCLRHDEVPGIHTVEWTSEADSITLTHSAHSRQGFALGAVLAAEFTATHSGLLTTDDLFHF